MDPTLFISKQSKKKKEQLELDKITENLLAFSNALQNNFLDDAQDIIRDPSKSFKRDNFDEAVLFLYMTVFYKEELPYNTILKIMRAEFRTTPEMGLFEERRSFDLLINPVNTERKQLDKLCLLKASGLSCSFLINLIVEKCDLTNICISHVILKSIVENNMYDTMKQILDAKLNVSRGIVKNRKKYRNTYDPEKIEMEYLEDPGSNAGSFYFSDNTNLALLGANYIKTDISDDAPTKYFIKEFDFIDEMIEQNKKAPDIIGMLTRIETKEDFDTLFILFVIKRKFMLINYLFTKGKKFNFDYPLFIMCLENDAHDIAVLLYRNFEPFFQDSKTRNNIMPHLLNSFSKGTSLIEAKCYLLKKYINHFDQGQCRRLLDIFEYKLLTLGRSHALVNNVNPIKTSCLLIEIVDLIDFYSLAKWKSDIKQRLISKLMKVVNQIDSIGEMRHLFMDQDLEQRDSLTFIWDNQIEELLQNPIIGMIVDELWDSQYNIEGFIWNASTAHQMLFNYDHCKYDYEYRHRFYRTIDVKKINNHCFMFQVWRNSGRSRYYIDTAVTFGLG